MGSSAGRLLALVSLMAGALPQNGAAQTTDTRDDRAPRWEIGAYVGAARHSLAGTHLGAIPDRNHLFVGVRPIAGLKRSGRWTLQYAPEVSLLVLFNNPEYEHVHTPFGDVDFEVGRGPIPGLGVSPLGLEARIRIASRWLGYVAGAAGGVWFARAVPVADASAFNYMFDAGGGLIWSFRPRDSLRVGYKFHHLSNAYAAPLNPGLDGAVFLFGFDHAFGSRKQAVP